MEIFGIICSVNMLEIIQGGIVQAERANRQPAHLQQVHILFYFTVPCNGVTAQPWLHILKTNNETLRQFPNSFYRLFTTVTTYKHIHTLLQKGYEYGQNVETQL